VTNEILTYIFAGLGVVLAAWGYLQRSQRTALWFAALAAGGAAAAAHFDGFWPVVCLALLMVGGLLASTSILDIGWRIRAAVVVSALTIGGFVMLPTVSEATEGKIPCPEYLCAARGDQPARVASKLGRGLDLRGGLRLVYTVDVDAAIGDRRNHLYDDVRADLARAYGFHSGDQAPTEEALTKLREKVVVTAPHSPANEIRLEFKDKADVEPRIDARFRERFRAELGEPRIEGNVVHYRVRESAATEIRDRAVSQAKEIVLRRVDELGLKEASVSTRDEDIIVEVPGESEASFSEIREIISQTARLEFKLLDDDADFFGPIADKYAAEKSPVEGLSFYRERAPVGKDGAGDTVVKVVTVAQVDILKGEDPKSALKRIREWASTLQLPPDRELGFGLEYRTVDEVTQKQEPAAWRTYFLKSRVELTGDQVRDARAEPNQEQGALGGWRVALTFTDAGGRIFEQITDQNVKRRFAIMLDGKVESAPQIQTRIAGGHAVITMGSSDPEIQLNDSKKLEMVLRSGALPAPITPSNEQRIGPTLGKDAVEQGVQGALWGAGLVLAFMFFYYRVAGLIANIAVVMNVLLQLAALASLGASMTLPGIAGLALTIGMGVDANVLITERIRDELRAGKSPRSAVEIGYERAFSAIIDGQLTTLIAGLVLAQYGTGPIKGFAVTLCIGVVTSIFTGVFVTRVFFELYVRMLGKNGKLSVGTIEMFPVGLVYDFMRPRKWFIGGSVVMIAIAIGSLFYPGPRFGTDFKGGTELEVAFDKSVESGQIRSAITAAGFDSPDVVRVQGGDDAYARYLVRVQAVSALGDTEKQAIERATCFGDGLSASECPDAKVASEVKFSPGGEKITIRFKDPVEPEQLEWLKQRLSGVSGVVLRKGANNPSLQSAKDNRVEIQLESKGDQMMDALHKALGDKVPTTLAGGAPNPLRSEWIGPKAGKQLRDSAIISIAISLAFIMAYVAFRFDLRFAPGGIVALIHDSLIAVGVLILTDREINLTTVAAVLTIIGYSINDTVVVYDRVREQMGRFRNASFSYIINVSLSEMLSRTIITNGTVIFSLAAFFVLGTGVLKEFAFTLILGITAGTYSSIYVALPATEWLDRTFFAKMAKKRPMPLRRAEAQI
jgi:preprotein translocase subunit SecD